MNFEDLVKSETILLYLVSISVSYILIKFFSKNQTNNFEKPYDYFKYYIIDTSKDSLKIFLLSPIIFIIINYLYNRNKEIQSYNLNILSKIVEEIYLMIVKIAKGYNRIE
jgi:hypothetical protein